MRMRAGISRPLIFVVMSILVVALMYSSLSEFYVFAEPPDPCFGTGCEGGYCMDTFPGVVQCCWLGPNGMTDICQECWTDDDGEFYYCDPPRTKGRSDSSTIAPPPSGVAPPSPPGPKGPLGTIPGGEIAPEVAPPTAPSPEGPTELTPEVDCAQNPDDPLCETATIPEGEIEEQQPGEGDAGEDSSGGGGDSSDSGNNPDEG